MENDISISAVENLVDITVYFKLDFAEQTIKGNRKFEEFKKQRLNELGKDAKLFYCKNENIYFYVSKSECRTLPFYYKQCPSCNNYVCYFCKRCTQVPIGEEGNCCIILILYYFFFHRGFQYVDEFRKSMENEELNCTKKIIAIIIINLFIILSLALPWVFTLTIYFFFTIKLYLGLLLSDKAFADRIDLLPQEKRTYGKNDFLMIIIAFLPLFPTVVFYAMINIYFMIIILIISLFTKLYPYLYLFGMFEVFIKYLGIK